jgi:hypothetical protein
MSYGESAPEQDDQKDDHQYQAKAPTVVMVWRTSIEATTTRKENQNNKK